MDSHQNSQINNQEPEVKQIAAAIIHSDEMNELKIEMIKDALAKGRYQINSQLIAHKLTEFSPIKDAVEIA